MNPHHGTLIGRLTRGTRWAWTSDAYRASLPDRLEDVVMDLQSSDRLHAKQGRSTARVRFDSPEGPVSVYLKRHYRLPWASRLAAWLFPSGAHSPGAGELSHLRLAEALGIRVPEPVAAGEWIGPWGRLQSFLMIAELSRARELNELLPDLVRSMPPASFETLKRELVAEMAEIASRLHRAGVYHKDLYLCHFFLDADRPRGERFTLIDLHRLARHLVTGSRWRWKDLAQLLYSTFGVEGITDRDRLRFWVHYRRGTALPFPRFQLRRVVAKAARYRKHNERG